MQQIIASKIHENDQNNSITNDSSHDSSSGGTSANINVDPLHVFEILDSGDEEGEKNYSDDDSYDNEATVEDYEPDSNDDYEVNEEIPEVTYESLYNFHNLGRNFLEWSMQPVSNDGTKFPNHGETNLHRAKPWWFHQSNRLQRDGAINLYDLDRLTKAALLLANPENNA